MDNKLLHTPEGVRDIYNSECNKKLTISDSLSDTIKSYGYHAIQTPTFEFFDIFSKEIGTTPSKELYKFFDKNGETLVLRPDMTPSVARCAAKYFMEEATPLRLFYMGNTFINRNANYQGRLNESTQIGAELICDSTVEGDTEIVAMIINCLQNANLTEFQVSIGEVNFFKSILIEAGIDEEDELTLRELISNKNMFGVEEFLNEKKLSKELSNVLSKLPSMFGQLEVLEEAKKLTNNKGALAAIKRLEDLYERVKLYGLEKYISFDLGMLSMYKYYTGVIIKAYTYGVGEPIVTGGRYDKLLKSFGKDAPSIGFMISIDQLMSALSRQKIEVETPCNNIVISYTIDNYDVAIKTAIKLRSQRINVALLLKDSNIIDYAKKNDITGILEIIKEGSYSYMNVKSEATFVVDEKDITADILGRA